MTIKKNVQLPRSSKKGVKPKADELNYGNLAVNFFAGEEFLSTKNSNNEVVIFPSENYISKHPITVNNLTANGDANISGDTTIKGNLNVSGTTKTTGPNYFDGQTYVKSGTSFVTIADFVSTTAHADGNDYITGGTATENTLHLTGKGSASANITGVVTTDKVEESVKAHSLWEKGTGNNSAKLKGNNGKSDGNFSVSEGNGTNAIGVASHAEGSGSVANGGNSHAEGESTTAIGTNSHVEGENTTARGEAAHAEGVNTSAVGSFSHAEGNHTKASGESAHSEGKDTTAKGDWSHAEGSNTQSNGNFSHAEGSGTIASGNCSHAEGSASKASGENSHAEGVNTTASGNYSHSEGNNTIANNEAEHACGKFNKTNTNQIFSIGIGGSDSDRKNAISVSTDGVISSDVVLTNGATSMTGLKISGGVEATSGMIAPIYLNSSDERLKKNIENISSDDINKIKNVNLKSFEFKSDNSKHFGVIAQNVEDVGLSDLVTTDINGIKSVDYMSLLILKIAELESEIKDLKKQINK